MFSFLETIMKRIRKDQDGITPHRIDLEKRRDSKHAERQVAIERLSENAAAASAGDPDAVAAMAEARASIGRLDTEMADLELAIGQMRNAEAEVERRFAKQVRKNKIGKHAALREERLEVIGQLQAALITVGKCLNQQQDLVAEIERLRVELVGHPEFTAAGHRYFPPATLKLERITERVTRYLQHVNATLWLDPAAYSPFTSDRVVDLVEAERKAQAAYAVEE